MKTCKACQQEIPVSLGYRDMEPREIMVAPKRMRLSSMILKTWFSVKNPMLKMLMYPAGFVLSAATIAGAVYLVFPGLYYLGVIVSKLAGWEWGAGTNPLVWMIGVGVAGLLISTYYLGKYITKLLSGKFLNEY